MRIAHLLLANQYIDNYEYQENLLSRQNKKDGHEVLVIASTNVMLENTSFLGFTDPGRYVNSDGIDVVRVPYSLPVSNVLNSKIRSYRDVKRHLEEFAPDVIMFHGVGGLGIWDAVSYKRKHPETRLVVDNHASYDNSALNWPTKFILHRGLNHLIWKRAWCHIDQVFNVSLSCIPFLNELYGLEVDEGTLLPLGGVILPEEDYHTERNKKRHVLGIADDEFLFLHTGKMVSYKRIWELVEAFLAASSEKSRLILAGRMDEETSLRCMPLICDNPRITYLGWLNGTELRQYLCAADIYLQGWTESVTVQSAVCNRCSLIVPPSETYRLLFGDAVWYAQSKDELEIAIRNTIFDSTRINEPQKKSFQIACEKLTYKEIARRVFGEQVI